MFEKINPAHPDKLCDRIAGALVDSAYKKNKNAKIAVEVLLGHGRCYIVSETSEHSSYKEVQDTVHRIAGSNIHVQYLEVPQDKALAKNQSGKMRCGDNGIFRGAPITEEQAYLSRIAKEIYAQYPTDGKYLLDGERLVICQSCAQKSELLARFPAATINPLGDWVGGISADTGAVNRKLGSDMGESMTGGGLHGKDLSKADVSVNIYLFLKAQEEGRAIEMSCAIGDETVGDVPFSEMAKVAGEYIRKVGGFEKFAEWGLIR